jgi:hypothetical protein
MTQHIHTIELSFEHANAAGDFVETLIAVDFLYYPAQRERGPSYSSGGEPAEPASWEYEGATWRDETGVWRPLAQGEWLEIWASEKLKQCDAAAIEDCIPSDPEPADRLDGHQSASRPDPDDLRDAALDRAMERGSWT